MHFVFKMVVIHLFALRLLKKNNGDWLYLIIILYYLTTPDQTYVDVPGLKDD